MKKLSSEQLKYLAIVTMLIDHIAWLFVPTYCLLGQVMHFIGRATIVIFAFCLVEGYTHTRHKGKYASRMFIFFVISQLAYAFYNTGSIFTIYVFNVMWSLLFALLSLIVYEKVEDKCIKWSMILIFYLTSFVGDWGFLAIPLVFAFYKYKDDYKKQCVSASFVFSIYILVKILLSISNGYAFVDAISMNLFVFGLFLGLPLLALYNGKGPKKKAIKYFFYIFYPIHLILLRLIYILIM